jgi:hypothetical protein
MSETRLAALLEALGHGGVELDDTEFWRVVESARILTRVRVAMLTTAPEQSGAMFICGASTKLDDDGLPVSIHVCPTFGLDGFATYIKQTPYTGPGY